MSSITYAENIYSKIQSSDKKVVHVIIIATKPDIIKQASLYHELQDRGELVLLCHTGQHHDFRYSGGLEQEFGLHVDIHLHIDGTLHNKVAQMIERFAEVLEMLKAKEKTPVPYIHGDTAAAMAIGVSAYLHRVACVHVEAGIRTLTPVAEVYKKFHSDIKEGTFVWREYYEALQKKENFSLGSMEPFPEQFNTRVAEAASGYHPAPVEIVRDFIKDEGFDESTIDVVGNTVVDATEHAIKDANQSTIFSTYPQLTSGAFIRFCVHRRENTEDPIRFKILFDSMERLVRDGYSVLLISLFATEAAIDKCGLRENIKKLQEEFPDTFIYSDVWPYYRDVIAAMKVCALVATDSGSMQEEMNILGIPCVTLRYGTDRGETVLAGGNVLAAPIDTDFVYTVITETFKNREQLSQVKKLYGTNVAKKLVDGVMSRVDEDRGLFATEEKRLHI
jgi:UDP-N-acetylglucosamine 2-epimerase (non-hydrolysing)